MDKVWMLDGGLVARIWPAERVLVGTRVCSRIRQQLLKNASHVALSGSRAPGATAFCNLQDLLNFQHCALKLELKASFCELMVEALLSGLRSLVKAKWMGQLITVDLGSCGMNSDLAKELALVLRSHQGLRHLGLSRNCIGDQGVTVLSRELKSCQSFQHLDLGHNCIRSGGGRILGELLLVCTQLVHLSVCWNRIGDQGLAHLSRGLQATTNLQHLDLSKNNIGEDGAEQLALSLKFCPVLTSLNLSRNFLGNDGVAHVAIAVSEHSRSLKHLQLQMNYAGESGAVTLAERMGQCRALETLDVGHNKLCDVGVKAIANSLPRCSALVSLSLSHAQCSDDAAQALADGLRAGAAFKLSRVDLSGNGLGNGQQSFEGLPGSLTVLLRLDSESEAYAVLHE